MNLNRVKKATRYIFVEMITNPVQMTRTTIPALVSKSQDNCVPNRTTYYSFPEY